MRTLKFLLTHCAITGSVTAMALVTSAIFPNPLLAPIREVYDHAYGKHGAFTGRKYRRGKNRCHHCGAPLDAKAGGYASVFAPLLKFAPLFKTP